MPPRLFVEEQEAQYREFTRTFVDDTDVIIDIFEHRWASFTVMWWLFPVPVAVTILLGARVPVMYVKETAASDVSTTNECLRSSFGHVRARRWVSSLYDR